MRTDNLQQKSAAALLAFLASGGAGLLAQEEMPKLGMLNNADLPKVASPDEQATPSPGKLFREHFVSPVRELASSLLPGGNLPSPNTVALLRPLPEFDPTRPSNQAALPAEQLAALQKGWEAALAQAVDLHPVARQLLDVSVAARGNPAALMVAPRSENTAPLSPEEQANLFKVLVANPFLAEVWNTAATQLPDIEGLLFSAETQEPLIVNAWVAPLADSPGGLLRHQQQSQEVARSAAALGAVITESAIAPLKVGREWSQSGVTDYLNAQHDYLATSERLARGVRDTRFAPEAIAALTTLFSLTNSPTLWSPSTEFSNRLADATANFAAASALSRVEKGQRERIAADLLNSTRHTIRLVLRLGAESSVRTFEEAQNVGVESVSEICGYQAEMIAQKVEQATAKLLTGAIDGKLMTGIDRSREIPRSLLTAPSHYQNEQLATLWKQRAAESSRISLSLPECEPQSENPAAQIYGLSTLTPTRHPQLFGAWAGIENQSRALNTELFAAAIREVAELARDGGEITNEDLKRLKHQAELGEEYIAELSSRGIAALSGGQLESTTELLQELAKRVGDGDGHLRSGNWALRLDTPQGKEELKKFTSDLMKDGTPLNDRLKQIESYSIAARKVLTTYTEGQEHYRNLRKHLLEGRDADPIGFISTGSLIELLGSMERDPAYGTDIITTFMRRTEQRHRQLSLLAEEAYRSGGASDPRLTSSKKRIEVALEAMK